MKMAAEAAKQPVLLGSPTLIRPKKIANDFLSAEAIVPSKRSTEFGDSSSEISSEHSIPTFSFDETLIFFDWDDTLFPTSWADQQGLLEEGVRPTRKQWALLQRLENMALKTLTAAQRCGRVVLVTNAAAGWVEATSTRYFPYFAMALRAVDVISARSAYEHIGKDMTEWKRWAFGNEIRRYFRKGKVRRQRNITSLGDSRYERQALVNVTRNVPKCWGKSIKFMEKPNIEQLIEQHTLLADKLCELVDCKENLDLEVGDKRYETESRIEY